MGHWFDDLTKQFALGKLSRREALHGALAAWAAMGSALLGGAKSVRAETPAPPNPNPVPPTPPQPNPARSCTVSIQERQAVVTFSSEITLNGKPAVFTKTITKVLGQRGGATGRTNISFAGASLMEIDSRLSEGGLSPPMVLVSIHFGSGITGVSEIVLNSVDVKSLRGEVNGRAIVPFRIGAAPATLQFQDDKPARC